MLILVPIFFSFFFFFKLMFDVLSITPVEPIIIGTINVDDCNHEVKVF